MRLLKNEKVINIMENVLNFVDARLIDHGKRVAYLIYNILKFHEKQRAAGLASFSYVEFNNPRLRDVCILAMLHDVGAYKTEEIDEMVVFETDEVWNHAVYGYLFLKYFSPLNELAPVILFHHADCNEVKHLDNPTHRMLAQLISLCDRADVFVLNNGIDADFKDYIKKYRNIKYFDDIADMFLSSRININTIFDNMDSDEEFNHILRNLPLGKEEVIGYIKMVVYSIDFRSSQTVVHTIATACAAEFIADLLNVDENDIEKIKTGAMLHDIGKIGTPLHILESTDKLSDADMEIMRKHVEITEKILDGNVDDDIMNIAVKHHEKLNGSGYHRKLKAHDIAFLDRIVSIADILSALCEMRSYRDAFSKEKVIGILNNMSIQNLIDPEITSISIENFDNIIKAIERESLPIIQAYDAMNEENIEIRKNIRLWTYK